MKRAWQYAGIVAIAIVIAVGLSWQSHRKHAANAKPAAQTAALHDNTDRGRVIGTGTGLAAADPIGTQRLEGQVLDADDQPVAGARVTVDAIPARTVETQADGTFAFDGMLTKHYTLVAVADAGVAGPTIARLTDNSEPVILRLRPGATANVSVLDAETGRPIAGAKVEVRGVPTPAITTNADGIAVLARLVPGRWPLVVSASGYGTVFENLVADASSPTKIAITLARGFQVRGRVIDEAGHPIASAQVWPESMSDLAASPDPNLDGTLSAEDGSFELSGVARGTYQLVAIAPAYASGSSAALTIDGPTSGIVIKLGRGARLAGRARYHDGRAATTALVRASWSGGGRIVHVDKDGHFELDTMPTAPVWVWARDASTTSKPRRIALDELTVEQAQSIELVLEHDGVISGLVVDNRGTPIEGVQVAGRRIEVADGLPSATQPELTDAGGRFTLQGLIAGDYKVSAARDARQLSASPAQVVVASGTVDVKLVLETDGGIEGRVVLRKGGAPTTFSVRVDRRGWAKTFAGDHFKLEASPGKHTLTIEGPGFVARTVDGVEVKSGAVTDLGEIKLERGRVISGRVVGASGGVAPDAQVLAGAVLTGTGSRVDVGDDGGASLGGEVKRVSAGAAGEFVINGAGSSSLSLVATSSSGRSAPITIPAGTDDVTGLTLTLSTEARLSGTVLVAGKRSPAVINAQPHASPLAMMTAMSSDGAYAFDHLAPGTYSIAAVIGDPYGGSPFYPHVVTLTAGARATLDLPVAPGSDTLTVKTPGVASGLVFVTTRPGTATRAVAMVEELGRQDGGQWALAPVRDGSAVFQQLVSGEVRACIVPMPGPQGRPAGALVEELFRSGAGLGVTCAATSSSGTVTLQSSGS
jgi:hypothetical protein